MTSASLRQRDFVTLTGGQFATATGDAIAIAAALLERGDGPLAFGSNLAARSLAKVAGLLVGDVNGRAHGIWRDFADGFREVARRRWPGLGFAAGLIQMPQSSARRPCCPQVIQPDSSGRGGTDMSKAVNFAPTAANASQEFERLLPELRRTRQPVYYLERPGRRLGVLISPAMVDAVLAHGAAYFDKGVMTQAWRSAIGDGTGIRPPLEYLDQGAIDDDLVSWRKYRRRAMSQHFSKARFPDYRGGLDTELGDLFATWGRQPDRELINEARELALSNFVMCFAGKSARGPLRDACDAVFASRVGVKQAVDSPGLCPYDRNLTPEQQAQQLAQAATDPSLDAIVRRTHTMATTFTHVARTARHDNDGDGLFASLAKAAADYDSDVPRTMLPSQMQGLFIAGTETVSSALTWLLFHLMIDEDLQEEIAAGDTALLGSCIHESLRLHPPAWSIPREALRKLRLGGEVIEPGTVFIASPLVQHYQDNVYPDAETFVPRRFMEPPRPNGSYYPFSLGLRMCPAMNFTIEQVEHITARLLAGWHLEPVDPDLRLRHWLGVDLGVQPDQQYQFRVHPRTSR